MSRYWVSWWSGYYEDEGCVTPPFQIWITDQRKREWCAERTDAQICALVDADSPEEVWRAIAFYFPDYSPRFCFESDINHIPRRFQNQFMNHTQLYGDGYAPL